ncbi:YceD family protein [Roseicitreum antarcticum]|uniref:Uncharacterized metal-binding protein YceD, DUF177 family n=1 Tax=Roseicitreum antarcticum TaxID=564137 RepID=A0A1H3DAK4_9RHOB|nr:DUF177 domain-containing protein [Roseicitreum antarcticum]SDX63168.1 Uncharacterized metal-binding protein YceD, DUF177 family [Roseicitreum antarcticum]
MSEPTRPAPVTFAHPLRVSGLAARKATQFTLEPDTMVRAAIAEDIGILRLRKLRFTGAITPAGRSDWLLEGELGATVVQECGVTLAPVTTRIDLPVRRTYVAQMPEPEGDEVEIPHDDTLEPLGPVIDPAAVALEALILALPMYPRAENLVDGLENAGETGTESTGVEAAPPGKPPLTDAAVKPFAGLAGLRDKLAGQEPGQKTGRETDEE